MNNSSAFSRCKWFYGMTLWLGWLIGFLKPLHNNDVVIDVIHMLPMRSVFGAWFKCSHELHCWILGRCHIIHSSPHTLELIIRVGKLWRIFRKNPSQHWNIKMCLVASMIMFHPPNRFIWNIVKYYLVVSVVGLSNANRLPGCSNAFCYRFTPPRSAFLAAHSFSSGYRNPVSSHWKEVLKTSNYY